MSSRERQYADNVSITRQEITRLDATLRLMREQSQMFQKRTPAFQNYMGERDRILSRRRQLSAQQRFTRLSFTKNRR